MATHRATVATEMTASLRVAPGRRVDIRTDFDPAATPGQLSKEEAAGDLADGIALLEDLQSKLAAQKTFGLLVVLQGIDASGKDGIVKHVMSGLNPEGVEVHPFKQPSAEELAHDFLWRYQRELPARGQIGIFNRSHYEEVLVVRVHPELLEREQLPAEAKGVGVWQRRYREINDWERYLVQNGIVVVKLFLHLSYEEQCRRFLRRIDNPSRNWKFSVSDIEERRSWDAYQVAFSEMLSETSTRWAPWHVLPADHKWFTRLAAAGAVANALLAIDPRYPDVEGAIKAQMAAARTELEAELSKRRH
jgi:PPK2 family polyphosphate:nucleotide phosphotransferase